MAETRRHFFRWLGFLLGSGAVAGKGVAAEAGGPQATPAANGPDTGEASRANQGAVTTLDEPASSAAAAPAFRPLRRSYDLVVVGGGIAGTSAAISAARQGVRVALVHNRSMLGGNSSSEVKLFPENNSSHQPWIKEGGIHEEFHTEERVRNHRPYMEGTMNCHWDLVLYEWVIREPNIDLYLNTHMHRALQSKPGHIDAVFCFQLGTEKTYELAAPLFVDATGDGYLGYAAGADFRWGREGRDEFGEPEAPPVADEKVMGNTLMFTAIDTGRPVPFKRPEWAAEFATEADLTARGHSYIDGGYWWIEVGAPYHPIAENDKITHEGLRQLLGVWDHIKNRCEHREKAANYGLEFVGFWPYKRECRRLLGDYVIDQRHVQDPQPHDDAVAYGAWGIDIHVQGGILARDQIPYEPPGKPENWDRLRTMPYGIPLRALYSRNVDNLMMAGRPISCTYVAFASSRVLSTGSIVGQAVGTAAALCKKYKTSPRVVAREHAAECQQRILRHDGHIPGVVNQDPADLARRATATASSEATLRFPEPNVHSFGLKRPLAQIFPLSGDRLDHVELMLYATVERPVPITVGLRPARHVWDYRAHDDIATATAEVSRGTAWTRFVFDADVEPNQLYYIHTPAQEGVFWKTHRETDGRPNAAPVGVSCAIRHRKYWKPILGGRTFVMRVAPESRPYAAQNVVIGTNRPDQWTNIWISDPEQGLPAWLELRWPEPVRFNTVQVTFDTDQNRRVTLPLFRYPDCVKDYTLEAHIAGRWQRLTDVRDNYVRRRVHRFDRVRSDRLRLHVTATNGAKMARVYELRVYDEA